MLRVCIQLQLSVPSGHFYLFSPFLPTCSCNTAYKTFLDTFAHAVLSEILCARAHNCGTFSMRRSAALCVGKHHTRKIVMLPYIQWHQCCILCCVLLMCKCTLVTWERACKGNSRVVANCSQPNSRTDSNNVPSSTGIKVEWNAAWRENNPERWRDRISRNGWFFHTSDPRTSLSHFLWR